MARKTLEVILKARDRASRVFGRVGGRADRMGDRMRRVGASMKRALAPLGAAAGVGAGYAVVQGFRKAIRAGADFEKQMDRVAALSGGTAAQMKNLTGVARELGRSTQFTAGQAAEAMSFFSLAGFEVNETIRAMKPTLDLAAAGQLGIAESADIAAKIMAGMGIEADQLGGTVDVLAKAFTTANTDLGQLGRAMSYVGPVAKSAGLDVREATAAIQVLSNAGIQAEKAGTTLRNVLIKLTSPSAKAQGILDELGLTATDAQGEMRPLADILDDLSAATADLGRGERLGLISDLFEQRAATGVAALLEAGSDQLRGFEASLRDAGGTAKRIADRQLDNLTGDTIKLGSAMESVGITIERRMDLGLRAATRFATGAARSFERYVPAIAQTIGSIAAPVAAVFRDLGGYVVETLRWTARSAGELMAAMWGAIGGVSRAGVEMVGGVITAMAEGFQRIFGWIGEFGGGAIGSLTQTMTGGFLAIEYAAEHWREILQIAMWEVRLGVKVLGEEVAHTLFERIPSVLAWLGDNWREIFTDIANFSMAVFSNLAGNIGRVFANLPGLIRGSVDFSDLWAPLTEGFEATLSEMPEIAARKTTETERTLRRAIESGRLGLGRGFEEFMGERLAEIQLDREQMRSAFRPGPAAPRVPEFDGPGGGDGGGGSGGSGGSGGGGGPSAASLGGGGPAGPGGPSGIGAVGLYASRFLRFDDSDRRSPEQKAEAQRKRMIEEQRRGNRAIRMLAEAVREGGGVRLDVVDGVY